MPAGRSAWTLAIDWIDSREAGDGLAGSTSRGWPPPMSSRPGGFGHRGIEGKIQAPTLARTHTCRTSASAWACRLR